MQRAVVSSSTTATYHVRQSKSRIGPLVIEFFLPHSPTPICARSITTFPSAVRASRRHRRWMAHPPIAADCARNPLAAGTWRPNGSLPKSVALLTSFILTTQLHSLSISSLQVPRRRTHSLLNVAGPTHPTGWSLLQTDGL